MAIGEPMLESHRDNTPGNESECHYLLKWVTTYLLWERGCRVIAQEVHGFYTYGSENEQSDNGTKGSGFHTVADTAGVKFYQGKPDQAYCVEAKTSKSDYKNGFCLCDGLNYIITPENTVEKEILPSGVGLIEVDMDEAEVYKQNYGTFELHGVEQVKRATSKGGMDQTKLNRYMGRVAKKSTNGWLYK